MKSLSIAGCTAFLLFLFASFASAQTFRGNIQGTITDTTGAAVSGAHIKVSSPATGLSRTVTTNDLGGYVASELPLGTYKVTIEKEGFRTTTLTDISVSVGAAARADAVLKAGAVQETVEVTAEVALVETANNTTGGAIESSEAMALPVNGHDYTKLLELVPGAASDPVGSTESAGSYGLFSLNGNRGRSNNYLIDGTDMNDGYRNLPDVNQAGVWGCPSTILPVDALAEIPVTGNAAAEFGRSAGATVNIVTKSGANQIHGSAFENFRNDALSARNYFNHYEPGTTILQPKNSFTNHQFGGLVSGPVFRDRTFFMLAYEGQREDGSLPQSGSVPTAADIADAGGTTNSAIEQLLYHYNGSGAWGDISKYTNNAQIFQIPFRNVSDNAIIKADQHLKLFSPEDLLTGRYFYAHGMQNFPLGMLFSGSGAPGFNTLTPTHVNIVSLSYTSIPRPNLIFEIRGGYNRFLQQFLPQDIGFDPTTIGIYAMPSGVSPSWRDSGLPFIAVGSYSTIGAGGSDSRGRVDTNYQLFGNVSLTLGRHSIKTGYEWRRTFINSFINSGHRGKLVFDTLDAFLSGTLDTDYSSSASGSGTRYSFQNATGAYFMDAWRVSSKITLNYGLRWDYYGVIGAKNNAFSIADTSTDVLSLKTIGAAGSPSSLYPKDWLNFAPRLSVADDLYGNGKLVLRAGGGVYYDGPSQDFFVGNQAYNTNGANAGPAFNDIAYAHTVSTTLTPSQSVFSNYFPSSVFTVEQNIRTPRYYSYNLNIESQLTKSMAVEIGYIGSQGRHLYRFRDLNQVNIDPDNAYSCGNGLTVAPESKCWTNFIDLNNQTQTLNYVNQIETSALSNYNSLQTSLKIQNWHGLTSTLNYTWSHSIDTASDGLDFVPNAAMPDDSFNPQRERASSNFDVRQRVQWYWTYNLLKGKEKNKLIGGWALDGMFNFATGQPYTVTTFGDDNGSGEGIERPDITGNPHAGVSGYDPATGGVKLLNMAGFSLPTGHAGSEGRNQFNAPNYANFDLALSKSTQLKEKLKMELRLDVFNILNRTNLANPLMPNFGAFATPGSGFLETTATPDVATGNPYLGGGGPRSMQVAAHFTF